MANIITAVAKSTEFLSVLSSGARTGSPDTQEFRNLARVSGIIVVIDVTAINATPSVIFKIQGVDPNVNKTWDILTSAAIVGTGTTVLRVKTGITPSANVAVSDIVPPIVRIVATHADADSITYSVTALLDRS